MPRFRLIDLLLSVTLIAFGIGFISLFFTPHGMDHIPIWLEWRLLDISGISIGAGIGCLFGKKWMLVGAVVGPFLLRLLGAIWLSFYFV